MDNKSMILWSNYQDPRAVHYIERWIKRSKDKLKVSCLTVIYEYNQYMGGIDLLYHMKVSYGVDQRNKLRFYMQVLFDFLDIDGLNSQVVYDKIQSPVAMSSVDLRFSLACSMIRNFCNQKRAVPT